MDQGSGFEPQDADRPGTDPTCAAEPNHENGFTTSSRPTDNQEPVDAVQTALSSIRSAIATLTQAALWSRPDSLARSAVHDGYQTLQAMHAAWLTLVRDLDTRPDAVPGARAGHTARTYLRSALHRTAEQAAGDVRAAYALTTEADPTTGGLPELARAFAAGHVSREHVDVAVRTMRKIPRDVLTQPVPAESVPNKPMPEEPVPTDPVPAPRSPTDDADGTEPQDPEPQDPEPQDPEFQDPTDENAPHPEPEPPDPGPDEHPSPASAEHVPAGQAVDAFFAMHSQVLDSRETSRVARHLIAALDPDGHDGFNPTAHEKRGLTHSTDSTGMLIGRFQLDPADSATVITAIEHFSAPQPTRTEQTPDGTTTVIRETRSTPQRRADALTHICRLALGSEHAGTSRGNEPPRITVHTGLADLRTALHTMSRVAHASTTETTTEATETTTKTTEPDTGTTPSTFERHLHLKPSTQPPPESPPVPDPEPKTNTSTQTKPNTKTHDAIPPRPSTRTTQAPICGQLGPISPRLLARFSCDALLQRVLLAPNGAVLDLGRDTRTVTPTQRRALNARDKGCVIPGCTAKPQWCEAHHVTWWRHGGKTSIENLALLCSRDHTLIHLGIWDLTMVDGIPWARPPTWIDPQRRLLRNTRNHATNDAHQLGTQLHLHLSPANREPEPPWLSPATQDHRTTRDAEIPHMSADRTAPNEPPSASRRPPQSAPQEPEPP
jgi:uncharacterized protein DUF222/HNH endonuclease